MKIFIKVLLNVLVIFTATLVFGKDVYVEGYKRSDGTHVKGHYRSSPNNTINDNYSTEGNINPYTGKEGWVPREFSSIQTSSSNLIINSNTPPRSSGNLNLGKPEMSIKIEAEKSSIFDNITFFGIAITVILGGAIINFFIYQPYKHIREFVNSPRQYYEEYGLSEVFWNFLRGVCIIFFWVIAFLYYFLI